MSSWSANLELPYMADAQAQKHVTHNEALERLDAIVQLSVSAFEAVTPPVSATEGAVWAIGPGAVNDWVGHDGDLAMWSNGGWVFVTPRTGWRAALGTDLRVWDGTGWSEPDLPTIQNVPGVGINTAFDTNNRLALASAEETDATANLPAVFRPEPSATPSATPTVQPTSTTRPPPTPPATAASLFSHAGAGHQIKINKAAAGDTASVVFQTGYSGRAEFGTAGSDNFSVKVSPDGAAWSTALSIDAATARTTLAQLTLSSALSPAQGGTGVANNDAATLAR
ncbi:MAG: DUF2793 domain-containing protein, partial [Pararhodobacter sp.]|nr:DUF2793 domain-containing protein [Pararhodobacter sp.]